MQLQLPVGLRSLYMLLISYYVGTSCLYAGTSVCMYGWCKKADAVRPTRNGSVTATVL